MKKELIDTLKQSMVDAYKKHGDRFIVLSTISWTGNQLAYEVENETEVGIDHMNMMLKLTIDLLKREKLST